MSNNAEVVHNEMDASCVAENFTEQNVSHPVESTEHSFESPAEKPDSEECGVDIPTEETRGSEGERESDQLPDPFVGSDIANSDTITLTNQPSEIVDRLDPTNGSVSENGPTAEVTDNSSQLELSDTSNNLSVLDEVSGQAHSPQSSEVFTEQIHVSQLFPKVSPSEELLQYLECPVCLECMAPPILLCSSGHNMCHNCRPRVTSCPTCRQPLLNTRNVALEQLSRQLKVHCINQEVGCQNPSCPDALPVLESPLEVTEPELIRGCPVAAYGTCDWQGVFSKLKEHLTIDHGDILRQSNYSDGFWELPLVTRDVKVFLVLDKIFLYRLRLNTISKIFNIAVHHVSKDCEPHSHKFTVKLSADRKQVFSSEMSVITEGATEPDERWCQLPYNLVENASKFKDMKYILKIQIAQ